LAVLKVGNNIVDKCKTSRPDFWKQFYKLGTYIIRKVYMEAKFSPRVKDVIQYSREEALRLGHDYIGTEHLLLGLIRDGDGVAIKLILPNCAALLKTP
jgi:ATP-dependent Clp protease ATP-binding subunit ClpA